MNIFPALTDIASSSAPSFVFVYNSVDSVVYMVIGIIAGIVAIALMMRLIQHHD